MSNLPKSMKDLPLLSKYPVWINCLCLIFFSSILSAQQIISVIDKELNPLSAISIFNENYSRSWVTDKNGYIYITTTAIDQNDFFYINAMGYEDIQISKEELKQKNYTIQLIPQAVKLAAVDIIGRTDKSKKALNYYIETIKALDIQQTAPQTSADALEQHSNVYVQKSQMGGGSPVVRGFEANKVLLVVDGVRLNNAIYRSGHLQNAITVDPNIMEQMEVIFGPGSLSYGSDALGGVIHFRTKDPLLNLNNLAHKIAINHHFNMRFSSANREKAIHYDLNFGTQKWAALTSFSFVDFDDLAAGINRDHRYPEYGKRNEYIARISGRDTIVNNIHSFRQIGTAYRQYDLLQKIKYQINDKSHFGLNIQFSNSSDIPRYDQLTERTDDGKLKFATWKYGPQKRILISPRWKSSQSNVLYDQVLIIGAYQKINEDRIIRTYRNDLEENQEEDVTVLNLTTDLAKAITSNLSVSYGVDFQHNDVQSNAFAENIVTPIDPIPILSRYPSVSSQLMNAGLYAQVSWSDSNKKWISNSGVRYNITHGSMQYDANDPFPWPDDFINGIDINNSAFTWSTGMNYFPGRDWQIQFLTGTAFRAPNIDDLAKIRIKNGEASVPNINLDAEESWNIELGISKKISTNYKGLKGNIYGSVFYTALNNVLVRNPFPLPNGMEYIFDGIDTLFTVANVNADQGKIYGISTGTQLYLNENWELGANINLTKGISKDSDQNESPLAHIPPMFGKVSLGYNIQNIKIVGKMIFNGTKPIDEYGGSTDNPEYATPEGSLAWRSYNLYVNIAYNKYIRLNIGIENILNRHYRKFASGVSAPGRNMILAINSNF